MKKTRPRFQNVDKYWIGADFGTSGWDWSVSRQSFTEYLKWEGGEENIGCIASKCTPEDGIIGNNNIMLAC